MEPLYPTIFNGINDRRAEQGFEPMELFLAVYAQSFDGYVTGLRRQTDNGRTPVHHVNGFVYEIRSKPDLCPRP